MYTQGKRVDSPSRAEAELQSPVCEARRPVCFSGGGGAACLHLAEQLLKEERGFKVPLRQAGQLCVLDAKVFGAGAEKQRVL